MKAVGVAWAPGLCPSHFCSTNAVPTASGCRSWGSLKEPRRDDLVRKGPVNPGSNPSLSCPHPPWEGHFSPWASVSSRKGGEQVYKGKGDVYRVWNVPGMEKVVIKGEPMIGNMSRTAIFLLTAFKELLYWPYVFLWGIPWFLKDLYKPIWHSSGIFMASEWHKIRENLILTIGLKFILIPSAKERLVLSGQLSAPKQGLAL